MSTKDKDRKRVNVDDSPNKKLDAKKIKPDDTKAKISDAELFNLEVEQSKTRDKTEDLKTFKKTVDGIRESLSKIRELKKSKSPSATGEICEQRIFTSLSIARLRKLNRLSHLGSAKAKETTSEKRSKNDQYHLQLQNLQYEVGHLQKEIDKCLEFRSKDEELSLVSVDEFYSDAPAEISRPDLTKSDAHEQRKARLQWEMEQRRMLAKQLEESKQLIEKSQADIQSREANLESLLPKLNKILEATRPVQEYLGMPFEQQREQFQLARYLPQPLFVLYRNLNSLESQDKKGSVKVTIEGDTEAAKLFGYQASAKEVESDSDQEEEGHVMSKHRRRMTSTHEEDAESHVLKKHPLHINLHLTCTRSDSKLPTTLVKVQLTFSYMTTMNMVTVKGALTDQLSVSCISSGDLMNMDTILSCIYSGDRGDVTPTPFSQSQLDRLSPSNYGHYKARIGKAFKWAQAVSGLSTLSSDVTEPKLASVASLMKKIRKVVLDRVELVHHMTDLERCNLAVPYMKTDILPKSLPVTTLHHWSRVNYEDVRSLPHLADYVNTEAITADCVICLAKLSCDSLKVVAHVVISSDYPATRPLVIIKLEHHKFGSITRLNSSDIKSIEAELNVGKVEEMEDVPNQLNLQIVRLAWCCDVFVAVNSLKTSQHNTINLRFIPNYRRGRDRQLPLTYNSSTGFFGHD